MQDLAQWLEELGMSEYAQRFAENRIDLSVLPELTDQHLKDIGIALGDRLKMLRAIRELTDAAPLPGLTGPKPQDSAERRQVTVLFSDLVGSTELAGRMDPEDLREVISAYQQCVADTVARFDGFVAKYMGDGVLVYFGYPHAHEDDAERAVRAGLAVIEAVGRLDAPQPLLATGLAVVGGRRRRSDRRGRGAGAGHCRRDAEPCGAASGACRTKYPRLRKHAAANRRALRDRGSRPAAARRLRRVATRLARTGRQRSLEPLRGAARGLLQGVHRASPCC
jgi:hypothetical protein